MTLAERAQVTRDQRVAAGQAEPRFCRTPEDFAAARTANAPAIATWPMYGNGGDSPGIGVGGALVLYGHTPAQPPATSSVREEPAELTLW